MAVETRSRHFAPKQSSAWSSTLEDWRGGRDEAAKEDEENEYSQQQAQQLINRAPGAKSYQYQHVGRNGVQLLMAEEDFYRQLAEERDTEISAIAHEMSEVQSLFIQSAELVVRQHCFSTPRPLSFSIVSRKYKASP